MRFSEEQSKRIYEFIMKYNADEEFRNNVQQLYDNSPCELSILQIYALEEVLRYGASDIFNGFLKTKGAYSEAQAADLYDGFIKLLNTDLNFKQYKLQQLRELPDTLSAIETFAFKLINYSIDQKEQKQEKSASEADELEYDPFNPILYSNDHQIRETLENLLFGEFIHQMLELPSMKAVKDRQRESGRIANVDKPLVIEEIQSVVFEKSVIAQFKQAIDNRFVKVKMELLLGKGEQAFQQYSKFNTNVSSSEILGIEKDGFAADMYNNIADMINKIKGQDDGKSKK